jgi:sulfate permease, SulP family
MKKTILFKIWTFITSILPLIAIIVSAHIAHDIRKYNPSNYAQTLKTVGELKAGLNLINFSQMKYPFGQLLIDVIPLTLIGFMESYSVSRKLATSRNELEQLDASQELFAIGVGNMFGSFSSGYPVCGSYSRTSLAGTADAKTPFTSCVTIFVVLLSLGTLTTSFYYIPNAALSGIIFTAVTNLISPSDFYEAWVHSKNDFFTMLVTFAITLVYDTSLGLAAGVGVSIVMLLKDIIFAPDSKPFFEIVPSSGDTTDDMDGIEKGFDSEALNSGVADLTVQIVRLNNDLVFLTAPMIKDTLVDEILNKRGNKFEALIIDFTDVKLIDISGMMALRECASHTRAKKLRFVLVNVRSKIHQKLAKFGVTTDQICMDRIDRTSTGDLYASVSRVPNEKYHSGIIHECQQPLLTSDGAPEESSLGGINMDDTNSDGAISEMKIEMV